MQRINEIQETLCHFQRLCAFQEVAVSINWQTFSADDRRVVALSHPRTVLREKKYDGSLCCRTLVLLQVTHLSRMEALSMC